MNRSEEQILASLQRVGRRLKLNQSQPHLDNDTRWNMGYRAAMEDALDIVAEEHNSVMRKLPTCKWLLYMDRDGDRVMCSNEATVEEHRPGCRSMHFCDEHRTTLIELDDE